MRCPNCHTDYTEEDLYCRQCGADLVVPSTSTSLVAAQNHLPAILYNPQVSKSVAAGVGALALGVGIELLRRNLLTRLKPTTVITQTLPVLGGVKDIIFPQQNKAVKLPKGYEI